MEHYVAVIGFGRHVVGVESKHDKLTMIPYLATTLSEPWWFERGHFSYSLEEKREQLRQGNLLNRVLAVRIKVEHANHKGWLASFGFFFASLSALLSFVSDNAFSVNSSSMLRAIISELCCQAQCMMFPYPICSRSTMASLSPVLLFLCKA